MTQRKNSIDQYSILSRPVVRLPDGKHHLTWAELCHGSIVWGNAGSGKTSGVGAWMLKDILEAKERPGMLALCVKQDERIRIEKAARAAGRGKDLVIISPENAYTVGALEHELYRKGRGHVEYNAALDLLMELFLLGEHYQAGGASGGERDRYWDKALRMKLLRLMMLLVLAQKTVSIQNMRKIMVDSFSEDDVMRYAELWVEIENATPEQSEDAINRYQAWCGSNYFLACFEAMNVREDLTPEEMDIAQLVGDYFMKENPGISSKTRAIVDSSVNGLFEPFNTGILKSHFSAEMSAEVYPERCYKKGAIIIVDIPLKEFGISSVYAVGTMKKLFQLCMERRMISQEENPRPCVLWCDEYHYFCSPLSDEKYQSSCRSTMTASVYITQSINNIKVAMGKSLAKEKTKALLTNLGTQIFCGNISRDTNLYAAEMIGKRFIRTNSTSFDTNDRGSRSSSEQLHYTVPPEHFATLATGGLEHHYQVETIMVVRGKNWRTGENFLEAKFDQRGRSKSLRTHMTSFFQTVKSFFV